MIKKTILKNDCEGNATGKEENGVPTGISEDLHIFLTHKNSEFVRGYIYYRNQEISILDHYMYQSLQLGDSCYDSISVIHVSSDPFRDSPC
jgi:hypothetical protein